MHIVTVVVTYNRADLLKKCIDAILNQTKSSEIIIIDNCSNDNTDIVIRDILNKNAGVVKSIRLARNLGGAGGFSYGLLIASQKRPDFIWIMDDDVEPTKTCLEYLLHAFEYLDSEADAICPKIFGAHKGTYQLYHHKYIDKYLMDHEFNHNHSKSCFKIDANAFVGPLFRGNVVEIYGLPIWKYFIWSDDLEFTYRIGKTGKLFLDSQAIIVHNDLQGTRVAWKSYFGFRNYTNFVKINLKDRNIFDQIMAMLKLTYRSVKACFGFLVQARGKDRRQFYYPFLGYVDGLCEFWDRPIGPLEKQRR